MKRRDARTLKPITDKTPEQLKLPFALWTREAAGDLIAEKTGKLAPMFVNDDSSVWAFFGEVCYSGDPFASIIAETRRGETKTLGGRETVALPYSGYLKTP